MEAIVFDKPTAERIMDAVDVVERTIDELRGPQDDLTEHYIWVRLVAQSTISGFYDAEEVVQDEFGVWQTLTDGRVFDDTTIGPVMDANFRKDLIQDYGNVVVQIFPVYHEDLDVIWTFESGISDFKHPFKSRIDLVDPLWVEVGYLRDPLLAYPWKDYITIQDPRNDKNEVIEFPDVEYIELDGANSFHIYYDIYLDYLTDVWVAILEKSTTWPPTQDTPGPTGTSTGNIVRHIGYAEWDILNEKYIWYQYMFEDPTEHQVDPRGEFEAWYNDDGFVTIAAGTAVTFNGDSVTTEETKYDLATDIDIWIQCESTHSPGDPSVEITGLITGTYPGFFQDMGEETKRFNYLIGQITGYEYVPCHKGRLHIDNTLLTPHIEPAYCSDIDSPRMMLFHDDQVTSVGNVLNDKLLYAEFVELQVRGGGVQHLIEGSTVEFYGLTETDTYAPVTYDGVDGTDFGEGSFTVLAISRNYEWDHGLVQQFEAASPTNDLYVSGGANIQINWMAGNATISSRGGVTDDSDADTFGVDGVDGTVFGTGSATITAQNFDWDFIDGHTNAWAVATGTASLQIAAGNNIKINYLLGVATISAPDPGGSPCVEDSIEYSTTPCLHLVGDEDAPLDWKFYGKSGGAKGWIQAETITVITDIQLVGTDLQIKTRQCRVFDLQTESTLTTITGWATTACP